MTLLSTEEWRARAKAHRARAEVWTAPRRRRRSRRESHPVHDFLFQYYSYSPGRLEGWHPGFGVALQISEDALARFSAPLYRSLEGRIELDPGAASERAIARQRSTLTLLRTTRAAPANLGCYGVHEWAMVYGGHEVRHDGVAPLRLPQSEIDSFVRERSVVCTHFDAFRFFAPEAKPLNRLELTWETRHEVEQPGCIHANMDLYRWAFESMPWVGSDLLMDSFELAMALRVLDMEASPYDLREFGFEPVRIETEQGRGEYRERQQALSERASRLRSRLIGALESLPWISADQRDAPAWDRSAIRIESTIPE